MNLIAKQERLAQALRTAMATTLAQMNLPAGEAAAPPDSLPGPYRALLHTLVAEGALPTTGGNRRQLGTLLQGLRQAHVSYLQGQIGRQTDVLFPRFTRFAGEVVEQIGAGANVMPLLLLLLRDVNHVRRAAQARAGSPAGVLTESVAGIVARQALRPAALGRLLSAAQSPQAMGAVPPVVLPYPADAAVVRLVPYANAAFVGVPPAAHATFARLEDEARFGLSSGFLAITRAVGDLVWHYGRFPGDATPLADRFAVVLPDHGAAALAADAYGFVVAGPAYLLSGVFGVVAAGADAAPARARLTTQLALARHVAAHEAFGWPAWVPALLSGVARSVAELLPETAVPPAESALTAVVDMLTPLAANASAQWHHFAPADSGLDALAQLEQVYRLGTIATWLPLAPGGAGGTLGAGSRLNESHVSFDLVRARQLIPAWSGVPLKESDMELIASYLSR